MYFLIDPNSHYTTSENTDFAGINTPDQLVEWCGLIPHFASTWNGEGSFIEHMEAAYGFPLCNLSGDGAQITEQEVWQYPGDPDLHPIGKLGEGHNTRALIYPYGLVVLYDWQDNGIAHIMMTRMD